MADGGVPTLVPPSSIAEQRKPAGEQRVLQAVGDPQGDTLLNNAEERGQSVECDGRAVGGMGESQLPWL